MSLQGASQLRARLKAARTAFKPVGKNWAEETVRLARPHVPVKTGASRRSLRVRNASGKKATVVGSYKLYFIDAGTKAHDITPRKARTLAFPVAGRTVFTRKVHQRGLRARPFRARAAHEALRRHPISETVIDAWNGAA